ncbi:unnamed protein product [Mytilus coruscus]|uniref:Uncharacterized protein n=1 Tax=Mytilus coruscus TaxID=42192 RepID=A0A6J8DW83_MYTCO|nr:unnamed protein product [Mytilus coruscus]
MNFYHTSCKLLINGSRLDLYKTVIHVKLCSDLNAKDHTLNVLNDSISANLKSVTSVSECNVANDTNNVKDVIRQSKPSTPTDNCILANPTELGILFTGEKEGLPDNDHINHHGNLDYELTHLKQPFNTDEADHSIRYSQDQQDNGEETLLPNTQEIYCSAALDHTSATKLCISRNPHMVPPVPPPAYYMQTQHHNLAHPGNPLMTTPLQTIPPTAHLQQAQSGQQAFSLQQRTQPNSSNNMTT